MTDTGRKGKILIVIHSLAPGGAERVAAMLSLGFEARGYEVVFALSENIFHFPHGGRVVDLKTPSSPNWLIRLPRQILRVIRLKTAISREQPDAVLSFLQGSNLANAIASGRQAVLSIRNVMSQERPSLQWIGSVLFKRARRIITPTRGVRADLINTFGFQPEPIVHIPNPVDRSWIKQRAQEKLPEKWQAFFQNRVFINVGRLTPQKGQAGLIRAFAKLHESQPDTRLFIMSEGELRGELEALVRSLGLADVVALPGYQDNPHRFMARAQGFILSSLYEGLPNVVLEALACGLPVVAFDCHGGGVGEIMTAFGKHPLKSIEGSRLQRSPGGFFAPLPGEISPGEIDAGGEEMLVEGMGRLLASDRELFDFEAVLTPFDRDTIVGRYCQVLFEGKAVTNKTEEAG
ncbi:MAG: glycosyltransferase [Magnetococcales bacterium]|nr:glycosyltransferase [Magnetococcales bacterium]